MTKLTVANNDMHMCSSMAHSSAKWPIEKKQQLLADKILNRLSECGLTRQQFANLMEVQPSIITRWLSGKHNFTTTTLFEIEQKLNFPIINFCEKANILNLRLHLTVQSTNTNLINTKELVGAFNNLKIKTDSLPITQEHNRLLKEDCSHLQTTFYSLEKKVSRI